MIVVLFGANELAMRRRLQELKDEADGGSGMLVTNLTTVDGRDAKPADVIAPCMAPPFLAPRRLVVVEHLLERFEQRMTQRGPRSLGAWEELPVELGRGMPWTTSLVFLGQPFLAEGRARSVTKSNPFIAALSKLPDVSIEEHPALEKEKLVRYINEEAALRGLRFRKGATANYEAHEEHPLETDPAVLLANILQGDTLSIANELDKLALYTRDTGGEVTVAEVNRVSAGDRVARSWDLTDAVINGDLKKAFETFKLLVEDGENLQGLLGLITSRYRALAPLVEFVETGTPPAAIADMLKRPNDWRMERDIRTAKRFGAAGIRRAYGSIARADRSNKMGEVDDDLAIEMLISELCALAPPMPVGRR